MTREEAIIHIKTLRTVTKDITKYSGKAIDKAFDMAIKALEQEPCENAISREDALMALTGEWTELTDEIIHRFIKRIRSLPSVNPQPCPDAISRQATLEPYKILNDTDTLCVALIRANIMQQPSVNPQPKTGRWIDNNIGAILCNYCHTWFNKDNRYSYMHYCPNCGAKMAKGSNEE